MPNPVEVDLGAGAGTNQVVEGLMGVVSDPYQKELPLRSKRASLIAFQSCGSVPPYRLT
jgi:hypothetical protein